MVTQRVIRFQRAPDGNLVGAYFLIKGKMRNVIEMIYGTVFYTHSKSSSRVQSSLVLYMESLEPLMVIQGTKKSSV